MSQLSFLPTEIIELISHRLVAARLGFSDDGLLALRLTCRALSLKAQYVFGRAAFSTLRLDLHPRTLKRLLDICRISVYGGAVKKIVFAHWGDEYITFPDTESEGRLESQVLFVLNEIFEEAFRGTPNLKKMVLVTPFIARFRRHSYTLENGHILAKNRILDVEEFTMPMSDLSTLLFCALRTTHIEVSTLETTRFRMPSGQNLWPVGCISAQSLESTAGALRGMQHLKISLPAHETSIDHEYFGAALRNMPRLTRLDLRFHSGGSTWLGIDDPGHEATGGAALMGLRDTYFSRLDTFVLRTARIDESVLKEFLFVHRKTLKHVALCYVTLEEDAGWGSLLVLMLDDMDRLEELCIAKSYNARRGPGTFDLVGRVAVVQHLGRILGRE